MCVCLQRVCEREKISGETEIESEQYELSVINEHDKIRIKNKIDIEKLPRNFYKPRGSISMFLLSF